MHRGEAAAACDRTLDAVQLDADVVIGEVDGVVVANLVALALGSTAVAYLIYFRLIEDAGPTRALTVTFLIPLFGVLWGALFLDEPLSPNLLTGGALIVAGTAVTLRSR